MKQEERKYKDVKTTEILDFVGKEIDYSDEKGCEKNSDYSEELESRNPFKHIKTKIDQLERRLSQATDIIQKLVGHKHDKEDGQVTVKIDKAIKESYF